jgi:Flp pilus assembly protein TadD
MIRCLLWPLRWFPLILAGAIFSLAAHGAEKPPAWMRVSSDHFSVLTDAGEAKGREVAVRLEQMRVALGQLLMKNRLKLGEPLEIVALKSGNEYAQVAPLESGRIAGGGFFLPGEDRNYMVFDASASESWRAVTRQFARLWLHYNYPPTQAWFDEGFTEYFGSIRLEAQGARVGFDPSSLPSSSGSDQGAPPGEGSPSLIDVLRRTPWLAWPDLFKQREGLVNREDKARRDLFCAQSWIVVHYLIGKGKLPETGEYFDLVENQNVPPERALEAAYHTPVEQFDQEVRNHFRSLAAFLEEAPRVRPGGGTPNEDEYLRTLAIDAAALGTSTRQIPSPAAQALLAEMAVRIPEHREAGLAQLARLGSDPKTETAIVHRALAWDRMQRKQSAEAVEELNQAMAIDGRDPWVRYELALLSHRANQAGGHPASGLSNIMQNLQIVIDWYPDFAEAYNMLAMARLAGGGSHSAMSAIEDAIRLDPRQPAYLLNMADIAMAEKKWDLATALLTRLRNSLDPQVAGAAGKDLDDLPTLKKYGIRPQPESSAPPQTGSPTSASSPVSALPDESEAEAATPAKPQTEMPDKRPVQFVKGTLVRVECRGSSAILFVSSSSRTIQLRTEDYKKLLMLGSEEFSCLWRNRLVNINYKPGGESGGDVVSVELR